MAVPFEPPRFVHAIELENATGLGSLKLTAKVKGGSCGGRTVLVVRVGWAS